MGKEWIKGEHPNYKTLRRAIETYLDRIKKEDMFYANDISLEQFKLFVEGKSNIEIKQTRKPVTYNDYRSTYLTFKTHLI